LRAASALGWAPRWRSSYPINMSNDAYKLATNYLVYGLTH